MAETVNKTLKDHVSDLRKEGMRCNCDLDNWEPEPSTGHSWVCRIHKAAMARFIEANKAAHRKG